jgi:hypothetical protein
MLAKLYLNIFNIVLKKIEIIIIYFILFIKSIINHVFVSN